MSQSIVELKNVNIYQGSNLVLSDVNISIDKGEFVYLVGKTGTGKSSLLETMAIRDLERGNGFALVDPHGDLVDRVAARIPQARQSDVIYLNAADPCRPA